jgi:hypothetical protein
VRGSFSTVQRYSTEVSPYGTSWHLLAPPGTSWHYRTEPSFPNSEATPVGYRIPGTASEAGGRASESRPGHHCFPYFSRCCANRLTYNCVSSALGAAWVPFGAAKIEETEVCFLFSHRVCVNPKREFRVRVTQLRRDPADAFSRSQGEARVRVTSVVQSEWADAFCLSLTSQPLPRTGHVPRTQ